MNLYECKTSVRVGSLRATHYNASPTFHVSAGSVAVAADNVPTKARTWAKKEYTWFVDSETPIVVEVLSVSLLDEDWE